MDLLWITRNFASAAAYIASDLVLNGAAIATSLLLAARFDGIGRWTTPEIVFMLGYGMLATATVDLFFGYNLKMISRRIGRGQLDHVLIQPQPLWMVLLTEGFVPVEYPLVIAAALALLIWSFSRIVLALTWHWFAWLGIDLVASCVIIVAFQFIWGSTAFWAPRAAEEINSSTERLINQLRVFPLDGAGLPLQGALVSVVPAGLVAWFPCRYLLGLDFTPGGVAFTPLAAVVLSVVAVVIFRKGFHRYGQTGSQRYLAAGHRR